MYNQGIYNLKSWENAENQLAVKQKATHKKKQVAEQFRNSRSDVILIIIHVSQATNNGIMRHDFFISMIFFLMLPLWLSYVDK